MQHNYVNIRHKLCCMFTFLCCIWGKMELGFSILGPFYQGSEEGGGGGNMNPFFPGGGGGG